jgi:hypothetical protein
VMKPVERLVGQLGLGVREVKLGNDVGLSRGVEMKRVWPASIISGRTPFWGADRSCRHCHDGAAAVLPWSRHAVNVTDCN